MNSVLNYVVYDKVWRIKPNYGFLIAFYLYSKNNRLSSLVDQTDYFAEVFVLHFCAQDASVNLLAFTITVVFHPLQLVFFVTVFIFSTWSDQIADKADDARSETGFCE